MSDERRLGGLYVHPIKSCHPVAVSTARLDAAGLVGDRRWMVIDAGNRFRTQRRLPMLARLHVALDDDGVTLGFDGAPPLSVAAPGDDAPRVQVRIWADTVTARLADDAANAWLSQTFERDLRLVRIESDTARGVDPGFGGEGEHVGFADGFPILIANSASLADLQARVGHPLDMRRFRPNIVIDTETPWEEDGWQIVQVGELRLRIVKPCGRCIMTTLDPDSGTTDDDGGLLQVLKGFHRAADGEVIFGQNAIPMDTGPLAVGAPVSVLQSGASNLS